MAYAGALGHEVFLDRSIVLLTGGLAIGWLSGPEALAPQTKLFFDLFKAVLALFMLEMGLVAASRIRELRRPGAFPLAFSTIVPCFFAVIGVLAGGAIGLSPGGAMLLGTLAASASYIAAQAAMRIAVPEANHSLSFAAALGVTFPFNIVFGIPMNHRIAAALAPRQTEDSMQTHVLELVVVITESALETLLVKDVLALGDHGFTVADVAWRRSPGRARGHLGSRPQHPPRGDLPRQHRGRHHRACAPALRAQLFDHGVRQRHRGAAAGEVLTMAGPGR